MEGRLRQRVIELEGRVLARTGQVPEEKKEEALAEDEAAGPAKEGGDVEATGVKTGA